MKSDQILQRLSHRPVRESHTRLVPLDKGLPKDWLTSLTTKGEGRSYAKPDLSYIGMPVGGICTGQVYLSGDGRLCYWDVFKAYGGRDDTGNPWGPHYAEPLVPQPEFEQGFAILVEGESAPRRLDASGFDSVCFRGEYPIGTVDYSDPHTAVSVRLESFSPFIPLDANESGLPATVMSYTLANRGENDLDVQIGGWMDNRICPFAAPAAGCRINRTRRDGRVLEVVFDSAGVPETSGDGITEGLGSMALALIDPQDNDLALASLAGTSCAERLFADQPGSDEARGDFESVTPGGVVATRRIAAGQSVTVSFVVSWYFPRYSGGKVFLWSLDHLGDLTKMRRFYGARFSDAAAVTRHIASNFEALSTATRAWRDCWYDSTLPVWFLDRTFANTSTLATQTAHRFQDGRFYGWEGVDSCPGTCQHVWQYAQAMGNVFPELERNLREQVDFGLAWHPDGSVDYRGEASRPENGAPPPLENPGIGIVAADGLAGTIVRVYREHKQSASADFLTRLWPRVKASVEFMLAMDPDQDGLLEGPQYNTLDATWFGRISWISSLFLAAVACGKAMAQEMGDADFAALCDARIAAGRENIVRKLFNGRYFEHEADAGHPASMDMGDCCYIDQVLGQSFAHQIGFERVVPAEASRSALQAIWDFNFAPDVGPYREHFREIEGGRWYAMPGEAGLLMCSWPLSPPNREGKVQAELTDDEMGVGITSEGYLNECMTGFEYQAAAHMIAEGLVEQGLSVIKAIDERYDGAKRNPYNEVECGDHYSRAMASFGAYRTLIGFDYHGPKGEIRFAPRLAAKDFRCAFIAAEGWGTYSRGPHEDGGIQASIALRHGQLVLSKLVFDADVGKLDSIKVVRGQDEIPCTASVEADGLVCVTFHHPIVLEANGVAQLVISQIG